MVMRMPPSFLGMAAMGLEYGEVECWMRTAARHWSMTASAFLARIGFIRKRWEVTGALSGRMVILKGIRTHEPKSVLDVEKTSDSSRRASPKSSMTDGDQPAPWRSNVMSQEGTGADAGADDHQPPDLSAGGGYGG